MAANEHVELPSGKHIKSYGSHGPFIEGLPFLKMVIFYSYVKLPQGKLDEASISHGSFNLRFLEAMPSQE